MREDRFRTTRRSVLKFAGGTAVGLVGLGGSASAGDYRREVTRDDRGNSQWILRFDSVPRLTETSVDIEQARNAAVSAQETAIDALTSREEYAVEKQFWLANAALVSAEKEPAAAASELSTLSGVQEVHPNFGVESPEPVSEQRLVPERQDEHTYGLEQMNVPDVWERFDTRGEGTSVAVLDTGIDPDHPDLELAEDGWAFFDGEGREVDTGPFDDNGHGTHVSGTVAGGDATGTHIGVAPETELYSAKVLDGGGTFAQIIAGMEWAVEKGVDIINMSLGAQGYADAFIEPVQHAVDHGTLVVSSSGNSGEGTSGSPANVYDSFAIGATDDDGDVAAFSSGELIRTDEAWTADWLTTEWPINYHVPDVSAPGVDVLSAHLNESYAFLSGTSMASPHVAGTVALLLSHNPDLDIDETVEYLEMTVIHGGGPEALPGPRYGEGIVDALSAVTASDDGNLVEGTVTYDGEPLSGVTVQSDFGTRAETNSEGDFSLLVADGEWTFTVDRFGLASEGVTATISADTTLEENITVEDSLGVQFESSVRDVVGRDETGGTVFEVKHLESVTISLLEESDLDEEHLNLQLVDVDSGDTLGHPTFGEEFDLDETFSGTLFVGFSSVDTAPTGDVFLGQMFAGQDQQVGPVETGPTTIMEDPEPASVEITDWDETTEVDMGSTLTVFAEVENVGDRTAHQPIEWWLGDPDGPNVFVADSVELPKGESTEVALSIDIPATFQPPGEQIPHGWQTDDDTVDVVATFVGPLHVFDSVEAPDQVDYGETLEITATLQNSEFEGSETVDFRFDDIFIDSTEVAAEPGETDTVTFEFDSTRVVRDNYSFRLAGAWADTTDGAAYEDSVWIGPKQTFVELGPYLNEDDIVDTAGLRRAIDDWRNGDIDTELLREVIGHWRTGEPVA